MLTDAVALLSRRNLSNHSTMYDTNKSGSGSDGSQAAVVSIGARYLGVLFVGTAECRERILSRAKVERSNVRGHGYSRVAIVVADYK